MWQLKDPQDAPAFRDALERCRDVVPGIVEFRVGTRTHGLSASCDVVLVSRFTDEAALQAYLDHPVHVEVAGQLADLRETRHVLDFEHS
jgi:quinol monooxygenase YgiN